MEKYMQECWDRLRFVLDFMRTKEKFENNEKGEFNRLHFIDIYVSLMQDMVFVEKTLFSCTNDKDFELCYDCLLRMEKNIREMFLYIDYTFDNFAKK